MKKVMPKSGFTVIEVALVLGIAGLIFLMVFIALPGLQRTQKDAQRREAVDKVITSIKSYQSNNRGALPDAPSSSNVTNVTASNSANYSKRNNNSGADAMWKAFYAQYLGQDFIDPDGTNYQLSVMNCGASKGRECTNTTYTRLHGASITFPNDHRMYVVLQAQCSGDTAVATENPRMASVLYKLEGAGIYCANT